METTMRQIERLTAGLVALAPWTVHGEIAPIAASFPNGAPAHSSRAYVSVEIGNQWVSDEVEAELKRLGWVSEQDGQYWIFYG